MPSKIRRLKKEAIKSCKFRSHKMKNFIQIKYGVKEEFHSECKHCHMWVRVIPNPYPNEIDIGGTAVALNCKEKVESNNANL
jgi:hypothetical protein